MEHRLQYGYVPMHQWSLSISVHEEETCLPRKIVFCFHKLSTPVCLTLSCWLLVTAVGDEHRKKIVRISLTTLK